MLGGFTLCLSSVVAELHWSKTRNECTEITTSNNYMLESSLEDFESPNTGRPADIELICWPGALHLTAEEVVLAGTHRAIVKPPPGTVQFIRKSLSCRLLRPLHPLLCGALRQPRKFKERTENTLPACWHYGEITLRSTLSSPDYL